MFSVIFLYPVLRTIAMSFFQVEGVSDAFSTWKFTGLDNYITLLQTPIFLDSMKNMLKIWVYGGIAVMLVSLLFAAILTNGPTALQARPSIKRSSIFPTSSMR